MDNLGSFLKAKLDFAKELDKAQLTVREVLKIACGFATSEQITCLSEAIASIDKAWKLNQVVINELTAIELSPQLSFDEQTISQMLKKKTDTDI